jgi:hypothetical protein
MEPCFIAKSTLSNTLIPSRTKQRNQWQYWILAPLSRSWSWCTNWNRYGNNFNCLVARWQLVFDVPHSCDNLLKDLLGDLSSVSWTTRTASFVKTVCRRTCFLLLQTLPVSLNLFTSLCTAVLFGTSLSGYTQWNASRTAINDLEAK